MDPWSTVSFTGVRDFSGPIMNSSGAGRGGLVGGTFMMVPSDVPVFGVDVSFSVVVVLDSSFAGRAATAILSCSVPRTTSP